ncbi:MAG: 3-phosphoshikimate 1-carboxyvinyltransferase [Pyrinomonadaceae bacterium]
MKVNRANSVNGNVKLPGDKSISHRAAMFASIAEGRTRIENFATSADCASTIECFRRLGVKIERDGNTVIVDGVGKTGLLAPFEPLDCGNSGTTMRLISGILAGQNFESTLTGDDSLQSRPMKRVIAPLGQMGAVIHSNEGKAPLTIHGKNPLTAIEYQPPVASAQIKSCILLAGLNADGVTTVIEPVQTRDHTERMLEWFGVNVPIERGENGARISVSGDSRLTARDLIVPSDISSAAFFMVAAACLAGSDIVMPNVGLNPSRRAVLDVMIGLGANIEIHESTETCNEPVAEIRVKSGFGIATRSNKLDGSIIANLIDEVPILAILGTQLKGGIEIRDASELRVKESDRIKSVVENLERMGATVTEFADGLRVERSNLMGAGIDSHRDHRISMAFAIAALFATGETTIHGSEAADVSFPGFFETLASVVR